MGRPFAANLDMYRKVPADLVEGTKRGSILSTVAIFAIVTLFFLETKAFFQSKNVTDLALDSNKEKKVRVNFNITMMDLPCQFATVDVVSVLGTDQNVTQHITKWSIDAEGVRQRLGGRNMQQSDVTVELYDRGVQETLEELHDDGEDAVSLDIDTLKFALHQHEYVFVDFYASWCSHCRDLAPTWEMLAEVMESAADEHMDEKIEGSAHDYTDEEYDAAKKLLKPVFIGKVDCVLHKKLCTEQGIRAYPTLRLFVDGKRHPTGDYTGDRTVIELTAHLTLIEEEHKEGSDKTATVDKALEVAKDMMSISDEETEWAEKMKAKKNHLKQMWRDEDHPGCQISGFLMVDRVPGNFHIQARSKSHDLAAHMTNVSHEIHHLSFGDHKVLINLLERGELKGASDGLSKSLSPMDGNVYIAHNLHEAHHHYLKVITTNFKGANLPSYARRITKDGLLRGYQILQSSQLSLYRNDVIPEAKFTYDLSPISISYRKSSRHWYDYMTSVLAIVGGTFTIVGMLESSIQTLGSKKRY